MKDNELARALGRVEQKVDGVQDTVHELKREVKVLSNSWNRFKWRASGAIAGFIFLVSLFKFIIKTI